jgi:hypothetical protein
MMAAAIPAECRRESDFIVFSLHLTLSDRHQPSDRHNHIENSA